METYLDPQWDILGYFKKQKELGRIKHLGFSAHAQTKGLDIPMLLNTYNNICVAPAITVTMLREKKLRSKNHRRL